MGVSLPKRRVKPPMPNPKAGACRIRILDPGGNEADGEQSRKIEKEMKKKVLNFTNLAVTYILISHQADKYFQISK